MLEIEENAQNICLICNKCDNTIDNSNFDHIINKLYYCIPELEWTIKCILCKECNEELDKICTFRNKCLKAYIRQKEKYSQSDKEICKKTLIEEEIGDAIDNASNIEVLNTLHNHNLCDTIEDIYKCDECDIKYARKSIFEAHRRIFHELESPIRCAESNTIVEIEENALETRNNEENVSAALPLALADENTCHLCSTIFSSKYLRNRHIKNVHVSEKNYKCDLCEQKFASKVYLNAHKKYHSRDRQHVCTFCGKRYITASDLYHHEKIHANKRAYQCDKCPKAFNTSSDLYKHRICCHSDKSTWKYVCTYCTRRFPLKTNLDAHLKTHTGEKNHQCHLCDYRCINRSILQRHIESHSNLKHFKCQLCAAEYKFKSSLNLHLSKVHGIGEKKVKEIVKKFYCDLCPKSFSVKNKFEKHLRTHTGEKPFSCTVCDKRFIDKSYVKQHMKLVHGF